MDDIPRIIVYFKGPNPPEHYNPLFRPFGPASIMRDLVGVAYFGGVSDFNQAVQDAVDEVRELYSELRMICSERWTR